MKRVYVDNSGQSSGLGLMGCRIAAGITTGMVMVMMVLVMMVLVRVVLIAIEFLTILMFSGTLAILVAQPTDVVKV